MQNLGLEKLLSNSFEYHLQNVYTAIPCRVITVHSKLEEQKVDVQPVLNVNYRDGEVREHPPILNVPLMFPASQTSAFTFPVNTGDIVLCVFSQRGLDTFKGSDGKLVTPTDFRKMDKRDAIAIPGLFPFSMASNKPSRRTYEHDTADAVVVHNLGSKNECEVRLKASGDVIINTPKNVIVNCDNAEVNAATSLKVDAPSATWTGDITLTGNLTQTGNYNVTGTMTATGLITGSDFSNGSLTFNSHVHTITSGSSAGTTTPPV